MEGSLWLGAVSWASVTEEHHANWHSGFGLFARYTEPFSLLVAQLAYEVEGGPELAYRFERFEK